MLNFTGCSVSPDITYQSSSQQTGNINIPVNITLDSDDITGLEPLDVSVYPNDTIGEVTVSNETTADGLAISGIQIIFNFSDTGNTCSIDIMLSLSIMLSAIDDSSSEAFCDLEVNITVCPFSPQRQTTPQQQREFGIVSITVAITEVKCIIITIYSY